MTPCLVLHLSSLLALVPVQQGPTMLPAPNAPPLADDDVSRLITGEFTGNGHLDAVVLANGKPVLRESVETYETYLRYDQPAQDIANLRQSGLNGRDRIVMVGPGGLTLLELQDGASPWLATTVRDSSTYWASTHTVRTGQVDGLHGDDIVAVTGNRVLVARSNGQGGWFADTTFVAGQPLTGLELVDWDAAPDGALELAVLMGPNATGARIRLVRWDATFLTTIQSSSDEIIAAPVASQGGRRWLAAVGTDWPSGGQELAVISSTHLAGPYWLDDAGIQACAAGDWDGDGIDDLVLSTSKSRYASLYRLSQNEQLELVPHPLDTPPALPILLPVGNPDRVVSVQDGGLSVADVDLDGDSDLVSAIQGTWETGNWQYLDPRFSEVRYTANDSAQERRWMPWHPPGSPWPEGLPLPEIDRLQGKLFVPLLTPPEVIPGAQYEYAIWRTPSIEALTLPVPVVPLSTLPIGQLSAPGLTWSLLEADIGQHEQYFPDRYTLILRQVLRNGDDKVVAESPALKVTFFSPLHADEFGVGWTSGGQDPVIDREHPDEPGGATPTPGLPPTGLNQDP